LSEINIIDIQDFHVFNEDLAIDKNKEFMISKFLNERMTLDDYNLK